MLRQVAECSNHSVLVFAFTAVDLTRGSVSGSNSQHFGTIHIVSQLQWMLGSYFTHHRVFVRIFGTAYHDAGVFCKQKTGSQVLV